MPVIGLLAALTVFFVLVSLADKGHVWPAWVVLAGLTAAGFAIF